MHKFIMYKRPYAEIPISVINVKASLDLHVIEYFPRTHGLERCQHSNSITKSASDKLSYVYHLATFDKG